MPHYVKKLWKKNYWHESLCERVFVPKTMTVIFWSVGRNANWKLKCQSTTKQKNIQMSFEMKLVK